jgi:hypothetical protein
MGRGRCTAWDGVAGNFNSATGMQGVNYFRGLSVGNGEGIDAFDVSSWWIGR